MWRSVLHASGTCYEKVIMMSDYKIRSIFDRYHIVADSDLKEAVTRLDAAFIAQTMTTPTATNVGQPLTH
jgi:hypothetical protein